MESSKNYRIEVSENNNQGVCSITKPFKNGADLSTGIDLIDNIEVLVNDFSAEDGIKLVRVSDGKVVVELKDQFALDLALFYAEVEKYFNIEKL